MSLRILVTMGLVCVLLVTLSVSPLLASEDARGSTNTGVQESIARAVAAAAVSATVQPQRPAARGRNSYQTPAFVLMGLGGTLTVLAFLAPTSASCEDTRSGFSCGTSANKGLVFSGLGALGLGTWLFMKGQ